MNNILDRVSKDLEQEEFWNNLFHKKKKNHLSLGPNSVFATDRHKFENNTS